MLSPGSIITLSYKCNARCALTTMKKLSGILFVLSVLFVPLFSFAAQVGDVDPNGNSDVTCATIMNNLHYGSHDMGTVVDVYMLQDFLNTNGYLTATPNGFFGKATLKAVKAFQAAASLMPTGYVGPLTIAKIEAIDCAPDSASALADATNTTDSSAASSSTSTIAIPSSSVQAAVNPYLSLNIQQTTPPNIPASSSTKMTSSSTPLYSSSIMIPLNTTTSSSSQFVIPFYLNKSY